MIGACWVHEISSSGGTKNRSPWRRTRRAGVVNVFSRKRKQRWRWALANRISQDQRSRRREGTGSLVLGDAVRGGRGSNDRRGPSNDDSGVV